MIMSQQHLPLLPQSAEPAGQLLPPAACPAAANRCHPNRSPAIPFARRPARWLHQLPDSACSAVSQRQACRLRRQAGSWGVRSRPEGPCCAGAPRSAGGRDGRKAAKQRERSLEVQPSLGPADGKVQQRAAASGRTCRCGHTLAGRARNGQSCGAACSSHVAATPQAHTRHLARCRKQDCSCVHLGVHSRIT